MLLLTFDEHGGLYDHVPPPQNVPRPDKIKSKHKSWSFDFTSLGVRVPALVISPYVPKGTVLTKQALSNKIFEHSSVPATIKKIFGLKNFLTKRDEWAATFEDVASLDNPRSDCVEKLPEIYNWVGDWEGAALDDGYGTSPTSS